MASPLKKRWRLFISMMSAVSRVENRNLSGFLKSGGIADALENLADFESSWIEN
jgi:hypothetical protein